MKFKLTFLLFFSFFCNQNITGQVDLPPLNLNCGNPWVESVRVNWTSLPDAEYYRIKAWHDGVLVRNDTLRSAFSTTKIRWLDQNGSEAIKIKIIAFGNPGFNNISDSIVCNRLICAPISIEINFTDEAFCVGFEETFLVQYTADFTDPAVPANWGVGQYSFSGDGIDEFGFFNIDNYPLGDYSFAVAYEEKGCFYRTTKNFSIIEPKPVEIECTQDSFLNILGIQWTEAALADKYEISINNSPVITQRNPSYLYTPQFPGEEIDIKVFPVGSSGCVYVSTEKTCKAPGLSSTFNKNEAEAISIFPNPSSGLFEVFSKEKVEKVEVFDVSGRKQKENFNSKIDLFQFSSGIYFLKIHIENNVILKKVVKI